MISEIRPPVHEAGRNIKPVGIGAQPMVFGKRCLVVTMETDLSHNRYSSDRPVRQINGGYQIGKTFDFEYLGFAITPEQIKQQRPDKRRANNVQKTDYGQFTAEARLLAAPAKSNGK